MTDGQPAIKIGLEVHVELATPTKLFCPCARVGDEEPNARTCPVCLGYPGARPYPARSAVEMGVRVALALACRIAPRLVFARKAYFYPDLAKGYQITQYEDPVGDGGVLRLPSGQTIPLQRVHLEEDPAAISYPSTMEDSPYALIDYNRSGSPLLEIVTAPAIRDAATAREFLTELVKVLLHLGVHDPHTCVLKADANISLRETGYERVEIKNILGAHELQAALEYEIVRQRIAHASGRAIVRETRGWDAKGLRTFSMRSKEQEEEYGYITEPDIPQYAFDDAWTVLLRASVPELPLQRAERYISAGVAPDDAAVLVADPALTALFERVIAAGIGATLAARWIRREVLRVLNYASVPPAQSPIAPDALIELLAMVAGGEITDAGAKRIIERLMEEHALAPRAYAAAHGLVRSSDRAGLDAAVRAVVREHAKAAADYRAGEERSLQYLIGQAMRATRGTYDPATVKEAVLDALRATD